MIRVNNVYSQLEILSGDNTTYNARYYSYSDIKSVSALVDSISGASVVINFINENRDSALVIKLSEVVNQSQWYNDGGGVNQAVQDICNWISNSLYAESPLGRIKTPVVTVGGPFANYTIPSETFSFSIANTSSTDTISVEFGSGPTDIPAGQVISFDAGSTNNYFPADSITINANDGSYILTYVA